MKKSFFYALAGLAIGAIVVIQPGCRKAGSFLDQKVSTALNEQNVFADSARTMDYLAGVYEGLYYWVNTGSPNGQNGPWNEMTDVASTRWPGGHNIPNQVFTGTFGQPFYDHIDAMWEHFFTRIRQCNLFLKNVRTDHTPFSARLTQRTRAEARFLRAYHYFLLMKGWGGVPIVGDTVYSLSAEAHAGRQSYAKCVDYVVAELDDIAADLPLSYNGLDYGRVTRGACLALKAKLLLFAASPLYNGGSTATDPAVIPLTAYPDYDADRWAKAQQAAEDVIDLGIYQLNTDNETKPGYGFYDVFLQRVNTEYILGEMEGPNRTAESNSLPRSRGGQYRRYPTQELVDAFPMANGLPIDNQGSGYDPMNPYNNRDPRLGYTVIYNGALYFDAKKHSMEPVWTYKGASPDGLKDVTANTGTNTGYYTRKMCDVLVNGSSGAQTNRCLPVIRYAEILLDLAEAANEIGHTGQAMQQLIALRKRAGIVPGANGRYGLPAQPSKAEARALIHNERMIELAFEGHRFWDLRRWKAGDLLDGKYMHGMEITQAQGQFAYKRIETRTRYFQPLLYYFPIPRNEVAIDTALLQNPGW